MQNDIVILQAPALDCDAQSTLDATDKIERRVVWNLLRQLWDAGFHGAAVDDGGDRRIKCNDNKEVMEAVFAVDEAMLFVKSKERRGSRTHWIKLVGGNGEDIISDWGYSEGDPDGFNAFMEGFVARDNWWYRRRFAM
jgi:hypothetical protein